VGSAAPSTSTQPGAAPSGGQGQGADPTAPIRFAVDLFDVDESAIAPGPNRVLEELGRARPVAGASGAPAASAGAASAADPVASRPNARDELWIPIVLLVLVGLCAEWALYHRDAVLRAWRGLGGRLRRGPRSAT
jgi:hypothetical protein